MNIFNNLFHKEFYPTPIEVLEKMQIDCENKICLEPHAGKGDIINFLKSNNAKDIYSCEINEDLANIVKNKSKFIKHDFFDVTAEEISHVKLIVMNPPFSNAKKHILHAFNIAPEGAEIISLCNYETIEQYSRNYELNNLIKTYGLKDYLGKCFDTAQRKTNVEVGLIKLFKPVTTENHTAFEDFFSLDNDDVEQQENGIMPYNEIRMLVQSYVGNMMLFDKIKDQVEQINRTSKNIGVDKISFVFGYDNKFTTKDEFSKTMQIQAWHYIFEKMNMRKYVTKGVMSDLNKFIHTQSKYPFTMKNIYKMFDVLIGTRENTFNRALVEAIDHYTKHTHENRYGVEGWKTNSGYMLNEKFIIDYIVEKNEYRNKEKVSLKYGHQSERLDDLIKVLCNVLGKNYNDITSLSTFFRRFDDLETNKWYHWAFFEIKVFKKGTMHLKFQNREHWEMLNRAYAKIKGEVLPEKL